MVRIAREAISVFLGHATVAVVGVVGIRLLTELADPSIFGEANLLLGILGVGLNIFVAPVMATQTKYHFEYVSAGRAAWFRRRVITVAGLGALTFALLGILIYLAWQTFSSQNFRPLLLLTLAALLIVSTLRNVLVNELNAERCQGLYSKWLAVETILVTLGAALGLWLATSVEGYLIGQLSGSALALGIFGLLMSPWESGSRHMTSPSDESMFRQRIIRYGLPFVGLSVMTWVSNLADRYILAAIMSAESVGHYAAPFSVASRAMLIPSGALTAVFRPVLFNAETNKDYNKARNVYLIWCAITVFGGFAVLGGIWFLGSSLSTILFAQSYRSGAAEIMIWVGGGYLLYGLVQVIENRLLSFGEPARLVFPQAIAAVANIVLALVLVPQGGIIGAAQANAGSFAVQLLATIWVAGKKQASIRQSQPAVTCL